MKRQKFFIKMVMYGLAGFTATFILSATRVVTKRLVEGNKQ